MDAAAEEVWKKYLEAHGSCCPHCGAPSGPVRYLDDDRLRIVRPRDALPRVEVLCYCRGCGGDWVEVYELVAARH